METAEILEAFTRKADGKILEVDRTQIFPQAPPAASPESFPGAPLGVGYRPALYHLDLCRLFRVRGRLSRVGQ